MKTIGKERRECRSGNLGAIWNLSPQKGSSSGSLRSEERNLAEGTLVLSGSWTWLDQSFLLLNCESLKHQVSLWILLFIIL